MQPKLYLIIARLFEVFSMTIMGDRYIRRDGGWLMHWMPSVTLLNRLFNSP